MASWAPSTKAVITRPEGFDIDKFVFVPNYEMRLAGWAHDKEGISG
jgi:hypothetical protein